MCICKQPLVLDNYGYQYITTLASVIINWKSYYDIIQRHYKNIKD